MILMKSQIENYLNRYIKFTNEEIDLFISFLKIKSFKKGEFILKEGEICKNKYFVLDGITRSFYVEEKGKEVITQFAIPNWWVTDFESFIKESPSNIYIQTLSETKLCILNKNDLEFLYDKLPKLERFFRIITENMLIAIQKKSEFYSRLDGEEKYKSSFNSFPDFIQQIPQYMLASYLNISPEHLSVIRKKFLRYLN